MNNNALALVEPSPLAALGDAAREFVHKSVSDSTHRAHRIDWGQFTEWCAARRLAALPASVSTLTAWIADVQTRYRPGTIERKLASISVAHQAAGLASPTKDPVVRQVMKGVRRSLVERGLDPRPAKKDALRAEHLRQICRLLPNTLAGKRDRALLLLGYAGGFRRSELSAIEVRDLEFRERGVLVRLRCSKTNQDGCADEFKAICHGGNAFLTCPVTALAAWLEAAGIEDGRVFRRVTRYDTLMPGKLSGESIKNIVRQWAQEIGLEAANIGAHSLRAGFVTDQFDAGTPMPAIMAMTGHRCERVLNGYYRAAKAFEKNLTVAAGL